MVAHSRCAHPVEDILEAHLSRLQGPLQVVAEEVSCLARGRTAEAGAAGEPQQMLTAAVLVVFYQEVGADIVSFCQAQIAPQAEEVAVLHPLLFQLCREAVDPARLTHAQNECVECPRRVAPGIEPHQPLTAVDQLLASQTQTHRLTEHLLQFRVSHVEIHLVAAGVGGVELRAPHAAVLDFDHDPRVVPRVTDEAHLRTQQLKHVAIAAGEVDVTPLQAAAGTALDVEPGILRRQALACHRLAQALDLFAQDPQLRTQLLRRQAAGAPRQLHQLIARCIAEHVLEQTQLAAQFGLLAIHFLAQLLQFLELFDGVVLRWRLDRRHDQGQDQYLGHSPQKKSHNIVLSGVSRPRPAALLCHR